MSETCHTPAPWRLQGGRDVVSDRHTHAGLVAAVYAGAGPAEELPANARLICAAPCLLAACERTAHNLRTLCANMPREEGDLLDELEKAIKKAKGD